MRDVEQLASTMARLGAELVEHHGVTVPMRFARPRRGHLAVRNGVGVTRHPWGLLDVTGTDRYAFLDDTLTCRVPTDDGGVTYGFLLDPDGRINADMYVVATGERHLCLTAPGRAADLTANLGERTFIQDVAVADATTDHVVLGVHGATAESKLASVMPKGAPPASPCTMSRGVIRDAGVTIVRLDAPAGEPGFAVVCHRPDAGAVFDALISLGSVATPIGLETWRDLTLEAGTPLFETELSGRTPNVCGQLDAGVSLEKGCFVGQETVARVANLGSPRDRLVGLQAPELPSPGCSVAGSGPREGVLLRRATSPSLAAAIGFAVVPADLGENASVTVGGHDARVASLPFVDGSEQSARIPRY